MLTLEELKKRHQYRGWGEIERYQDRKLDEAYMHLIVSFGGVLTVFDIIILVVG